MEQARRLAEKAGAPPIVRAWIAATEADARAHLNEVYKSEVAMERATKWTSLGLEQGAYPVPYDLPWLRGFAGHTFLKPWRDSPVVKDLHEELRALQLKLLFV